MLKKTFSVFLSFLLFFENTVLFAAEPTCLQPQDAVIPPQYNPVSGYCETYPVDEKGNCPQGYVFSSVLRKCISYPLCEGNTIWDPNLKQCKEIVYFDNGTGEGFFLNPDQSYCAVDLNGDGDVSQDEIFECIQTSQGYICSYGMTECNPQYQFPDCPDGYIYNSSTQKCEASIQTGVCSSQEVSTTQYQCPTTGQIYSDLNECNSACIQTAYCNLVCPSGYTYNFSTEKCEADAMFNSCAFKYGTYTHTVSPSSWSERIIVDFAPPEACGKIPCPVYGWVYFDSACNITKMAYCIDCRSLNQNAIREVFISPGKSYSFSYNFYGYSYNIYTIYNISQFSCPSGGTYNFSTGKCEADSSYNCPLGNYLCSGNPPVCTKGQTCITQNTTTTKWLCSLDGVLYDMQDQCITSCHDFCPAGGTYNPSTGKCEADPVCSNETFQDGKCFTGYTCPLGNYQCHLINGKWMCSPYQCINPSQIEDDEPDTIPSGYQDDGSKDENGNCLGSILIFNGYEMRCRPAGVQTGFHNCCDEAQGKLYDSTGSLSGTFQTVKNVVAAIAAAKQAVQVGYYATKIASGKYALQAVDTATVRLVDISTGKTVAAFASDSPEAVALGGITSGMNLDQAAFQGMQNYAVNLKADIALSIVNLATSQLIDDPVLSATVNLAATAVLPSFFEMSINPAGMAFAVANLAMSFFAGSCDKQDIMTSTYVKSGYCHYVGSKCIKKWPLVGCVQRTKVYCCFNSKLARIIHEQGRPQLKTFQENLKGIWGDAEDPLCRGFTPEEFQALDFSQMDLSEYYEDIQKNVNKNVQTMIETQIGKTYQGLKN